MTAIIDVAAVDDHPIVLDGVAGWVMAAESGIRVVGTALTVDALLAGQDAARTWSCWISISATGRPLSAT